MVGEGLTPENVNPIENPLKREINSVIGRIKTHINTPPLDRKLKNHFRELTAHQISLYKKVGIPSISEDSPEDQFLFNIGASLGMLGIPDLIFMYKQISKKEFIPDDHHEFFGAVKKAPSWLLKQFQPKNTTPGASTTEIIETMETTVDSEQDGSEMGIYTFWLFAKLLDVYITGLGLNASRYRNIPKQFRYSNTKEDAVGIIFLSATRTYFHPGTITTIIESFKRSQKNLKK